MTTLGATPSTTTVLSGAETTTAITGTKIDDLTAGDDTTDLNASTTKHGLLPKLNNNAANFLDGTGAWTTPAGSGSGAPDDATYLVTTAHAGLSAEVAVGATPGGELGGTWGTPTVDATHSGSSHAGLSGQPGSTDVAIADGGTGASTAAGARANLGLAITRLQRTLSPTEMKGASTPVELIAAPGAGFWITVMWIAFTMKYTAPAYGVSGTAVVRIGSTTLLNLAPVVPNTASVGLSQPPVNQYTFLTAFENQPVQFFTSVNLTNGNSNCAFDIWYAITPVPA